MSVHGRGSGRRARPVAPAVRRAPSSAVHVGARPSHVARYPHIPHDPRSCQSAGVSRATTGDARGTTACRPRSVGDDYNYYHHDVQLHMYRTDHRPSSSLRKMSPVLVDGSLAARRNPEVAVIHPRQPQLLRNPTSMTRRRSGERIGDRVSGYCLQSATRRKRALLERLAVTIASRTPAPPAVQPDARCFPTSRSWPGIARSTCVRHVSTRPPPGRCLSWHLSILDGRLCLWQK